MTELFRKLDILLPPVAYGVIWLIVFPIRAIMLLILPPYKSLKNYPKIYALRMFFDFKRIR